jgi:hypothetical protein
MGSSAYHNDIPLSPDCSFMTPHESKQFLSAYTVIHQEEAWFLLANFTGDSFMFSTDKKILDLMTKIDHANIHSGASLGCVMQQLRYIAKNGFSAFRECMT